MSNPIPGFGSFQPGTGTDRPARASSSQASVPANRIVVDNRPPNVTPHDPSLGGGSAQLTAAQVRSMQQFLVNHGFNVAQDGIMGPQTKAAAQAFRTDHKAGAKWSAANGIGVHPSVQPHGSTGDTVPAKTTRTTAGAGAGSGLDARSTFNSLLSALLAAGGHTGSMLDPTSFGDAAAAPSAALAATLSRQAAQNPKQEAQNQSDISSWYGLDPQDPNYKLSVLGRLAEARTRDASAATDASSNVSDIAKQLASSIGGSANDGSAQVAAAGADAAGTMGALGEASKQYADDMSPLLTAEARGASSKESATSQQALLDLQDKLAQARGQATADRATGVAGATDRHNALGQQHFANEGNLLSTLAEMNAADPATAGLKDAKLKAQIWAIQHPGAAHPGKAASAPHVDLANVGNSVASLLGVGTDHKLPAGVSPTKLAYTIGSQLQSLGFKRGTPEYQRYAQQLMSVFNDANGDGLKPPRSWFGPGS
jgi:hypothetical protein